MAEEGVLDVLEAEAIHVLREVAGAFRRPVLLYSIGKDSSVLLHLATKAFAPGRMPFPVLHVDTGWKFREMIAFRDDIAKRLRLDLRVHTNPEGATPFTHGAHEYTRIMKTVTLRRALDESGFDAAIGGARRDEERSRAKERIFSLREPGHRWEPRSQRPEFWRRANTELAEGQTMRVFPLSNWTELDIWRYIQRENIAVVPLYFAAPRPVVEREGSLIMVDDDRFPLEPGEQPQPRHVRFRTLGCYPLTAAVESKAENVEEVIDEMRLDRRSERAGRLIDGEGGTSMESKKSEGYF
ncbi:sulfate adenylyltransferase subunit CysD [Lentzea californiensis]|uniref:sulfate adenylyltransferase subunit CysD n=1 Tax=Lentzea californiensis TaxID=438851 RepID=UPI002165FC0F|nr:sulfate adenylyltransferase subunit CysD [Lentzea californiensis]MCR3750121.1 sulfate adenylyltransferase subunit 2 (EC 2.7.7.4) [Lentzea californiensis]